MSTNRLFQEKPVEGINGIARGGIWKSMEFQGVCQNLRKNRAFSGKLMKKSGKTQEMRVNIEYPQHWDSIKKRPNTRRLNQIINNKIVSIYIQNTYNK